MNKTTTFGYKKRPKVHLGYEKDYYFSTQIRLHKVQQQTNSLMITLYICHYHTLCSIIIIYLSLSQTMFNYQS